MTLFIWAIHYFKKKLLGVKMNLVQQHAVNSAIKLQLIVCAYWTVFWLTCDITDSTQVTKTI